MLYYPQLLTGCISQYPVTRRNVRRTVINRLADGNDIRTQDDGAVSVGWDLSYKHLTLSELSAIQDLFVACLGRWQTFTFLDPTDNLLIWSEDLTQLDWKADPLLALSPGLVDPFGGQAGTRVTNTAQVAQEILQTLSAPAGYQYCLSAYVKSDQPAPIELVAMTGSEETRGDFTAGPAWRRLAYTFQMQSKDDGLKAGLRLQPGNSVGVFGLQMEPQMGSGGYKKTRDRGGVYPAARFDTDRLQATAAGLHQYSCEVKIVSNVAG